MTLSSVVLHTAFDSRVSTTTSSSSSSTPPPLNIKSGLVGLSPLSLLRLHACCLSLPPPLPSSSSSRSSLPTLEEATEGGRRKFLPPPSTLFSRSGRKEETILAAVLGREKRRGRGGALRELKRGGACLEETIFAQKRRRRRRRRGSKKSPWHRDSIACLREGKNVIFFWKEKEGKVGRKSGVKSPPFLTRCSSTQYSWRKKGAFLFLPSFPLLLPQNFFFYLFSQRNIPFFTAL